MIPEGSYLAKVTMPLTWHQHSEGKSDQVSTRFILLEGNGNGQTIAWRGALKEGKAEELTIQALEAMGYDFDSDASVVGKDAVVVVRHEEYDGKTQVRIAFVNDAGGGGGKYVPMPEPLKNAAKARLKALARAGALANGGEPGAAFDKF